jgi:hypothetical protein
MPDMFEEHFVGVPKFSEAVEQWAAYYFDCEVYGRTVCSNHYLSDNMAFPQSYEESAKCNRFNRDRLVEVEEYRRRNPVSDYDWAESRKEGEKLALRRIRDLDLADERQSTMNFKSGEGWWKDEQEKSSQSL